MKKHIFTAVTLFLLVYGSAAIAQSVFEWPDSPGGAVYQDFLNAYNQGNPQKIRAFVKEHYDKMDAREIEETTEYWMDIFSRFGKAKPHSLSINKPYDLEVWLQGNISKTWFAPEFVLNKNTSKIKAVGMLLGSQPSNQESPAPSIKKFTERIENYLQLNEKAQLFQGSVLMIHKGKVIHNKGYGYRDLSKGKKNTVRTRFDIASITKPITAIAILQLVQKGLLSLNMPIEKYLPELPKHISKKITISQLLTHTSGYKLKKIKGFREEIAMTSSLSEVYQTHLKYLEKWKGFSSKNKWSYSNQGYDLLAIIVEKISGLSFSDYLEQNIFIPAEITNTSFSPTNTSIPYRYDLKSNGLKDQREYPPFFGKVSGAAQLKSTTHDLAKLFNFIKSKDLLLDQVHKSLLISPLIRRSRSEYQTLGLKVSYETVLNWGHGGVYVGNTSELRYFPDSDLLLIVLSNNRSGAPNLYNFVKNNLPR